MGSKRRTQHKRGTQWMCVEWMDGGSPFLHSPPGPLESVCAGWARRGELGGGPGLPRPNTDMSLASCFPLYHKPVLDGDWGQNQSAEKDQYPGATDLASGMGFSWTNDNIYAVLSSKESAQNGENKAQAPWVRMYCNVCNGQSGHKYRHYPRLAGLGQ